MQNIFLPLMGKRFTFISTRRKQWMLDGINNQRILNMFISPQHGMTVRCWNSLLMLLLTTVWKKLKTKLASMNYLQAIIGIELQSKSLDHFHQSFWMATLLRKSWKISRSSIQSHNGTFPRVFLTDEATCFLVPQAPERHHLLKLSRVHWRWMSAI